MCIGLPMTVVAPAASGPHRALCRRGSDLREIDLALVGPQPAGAHLLVFLDTAREVLDEARAAAIEDAVAAVEAVMAGLRPDDAFADIAAREPTLPPHLEEARRRGLATG